jgi:beta-phosphoglucomutase
VDLIAAGAFSEFPDGVRFALALKARGVRLAAASSSKNARELLAKVPLALYQGPAREARTLNAGATTLLDLIDADVSGRDLPQGKPHPAIFLLAAEELGLSPISCFVVEDAPVGIQAAKAGQITAIGVARADDEALLAAAGADLVVATLDDVDVDALGAGHVQTMTRR